MPSPVFTHHSPASSSITPMASAASALAQTLSLHQVRNEQRSAHGASRALPKPAAATPPVGLPGRRQMAFLLTTSTVLTMAPRPSAAQDIPLFGLRKKLRKAEEGAEELVREGFEAAEKGIVTAEKGIVAAEKGFEKAEQGIETAEREIEGAVSFGGLAQAGVVAAVELVGVLVATSVVNGILGPEGQRS